MGKKKNNNETLGWDNPLPDTLLSQRQRWQNSLADLQKVAVPHCYHPIDFDTVARRQIHTFSDASKPAKRQLELPCTCVKLTRKEKFPYHCSSDSLKSPLSSPGHASCRENKQRNRYEDRRTCVATQVRSWH